MRGPHPEAELVAWLRGELPPAERQRVEAHLDACGECRRTHEAFAAILADLRGAGAPPLDAARWRAELRARVAGAARPWWQAPRTWAVAAAAAGIALVLALPFGLPWLEPAAPRDLAAVEEVVLGRRLPLLRQLPVVERLELLENLELIAQLDTAVPGGAAPER